MEGHMDNNVILSLKPFHGSETGENEEGLWNKNEGCTKHLRLLG